MLKALRDKLRGLLDERAERQAELDAVLATVETEARSALTEAEETEFRSITARLSEIDTERPELEARISELEELDRRNAEAEEIRSTLGPDTTNPTRPGQARVSEEPEVYRADLSDVSFFSDAWAAQSGRASRSAQERLSAHERRTSTERRDVGSSAFGALVVPQYLVDLFAPIARAGRPFANACMSLPLPAEGMSLAIPRGTTGTATAAQATENSAVQETDFDETTLTVNVRTYAGAQDVSRQSLERGAGIDSIVYADLAGAYAANVNADLLHGAGTSGTHLGIAAVSSINAVTYTDGSPTVAEMFPKLADAVQQVNAGRFLPAEAWIMHPRRWGWFTAAVDTAGRPLVVPSSSGPYNSVGVNQANGYGQVVGELLGLPVITDAGVATTLGGGTEDMIFAVRLSDMLLWEEGDGSPRELRFEETTGGSLTVKLVVYGYSAFAGGRYPEAIATVGGTGLAAPTF